MEFYFFVSDLCKNKFKYSDFDVISDLLRSQINPYKQF